MKQVIVITGASSGFGKAAAEMLAERGHTVYGLCRRDMEHSKIRYRACDIRNREAIAATVADIMGREGRIDVLVNNAGMGIGGALELASEAEIDRQMGTNFMGCANMCQAVLPHMRKARKGRIVTVSSIGGVMGLPYQGYYSASKFAIEGFSEALAAEVKRFGIRVSLVEPPQLPGDAAGPGLRPCVPRGAGAHQRRGERRAAARGAGAQDGENRRGAPSEAALRGVEPRAVALGGGEARAERQPDGGHPAQLLQVLTRPTAAHSTPQKKRRRLIILPGRLGFCVSYLT